MRTYARAHVELLPPTDLLRKTAAGAKLMAQIVAVVESR